MYVLQILRNLVHWAASVLQSDYSERRWHHNDDPGGLMTVIKRRWWTDDDDHHRLIHSNQGHSHIIAFYFLSHDGHREEIVYNSAPLLTTICAITSFSCATIFSSASNLSLLTTIGLWIALQRLRWLRFHRKLAVYNNIAHKLQYSTISVCGASLSDDKVNDYILRRRFQR